MRIVLSCGKEGLWEYRGRWQALDCPLPCPDLTAFGDGCLAALDPHSRQLWAGSQPFPVDGGVEAFCLLSGRALTLSGETDCLSLHDLASGQLLMTAPAGVYPQDFCFASPQLLAVCGGGDGTVRLYAASDLTLLRLFHLPGLTERIAFSGGHFHVLCAVGDTSIQCRYVRLHPSGQMRMIATLPGLPGAVCGDGGDGVWVASSGTLCHYPHAAFVPDRVLGGSGLIRHMVCAEGLLLVSDPVGGAFSAINRQGQTVLSLPGEVGQAVILP